MSTQDQPLVTFVMPCYNSAAFMQRGIDSLIAATESAGHACEILLINDGSSDDTSAIAHDYASRHAHVSAIDQENANWGGVVNHGLELARGMYFKVLDSDDYFDVGDLVRVLDTLALAVEANQAPDLLITNYVYDHLRSKSQRVMQYRKFFPAGRVFEWREMGPQGQDKFIMIHAAWYQTALLRESGVKLPVGVSYMDSMLLLHPMPYVKKLFYLDIAPYHYIIGREGQSVAIEVVKKHIDDQLMATRLAISDIDYAPLYEREPNCAMLMTGYISCMMSVSTIHLFKINTPESIEKNRRLWAYLIEKNPTLYENVQHSWAWRSNRKTGIGRQIARFGYWLAQKIYRFA